MSIETIARRYSTALADVALSSGGVDTIKSELSGWNELFSQNADLQTVFSNPAIAQSNKEKVLDGLIAKAKPSTTTANFLRILLKNGRLSELSEISSKFESVLDERSGVVAAQITSAREMPQDEKAEFESELAKLAGKTVTVSYTIDPEIIGGVITRIGSTVYDGSVKTKLENLKEQLVNG